MKTIIILSRSFAFFFLLISVLGYLWFLGSFDIWSNAYFFSTFFALSIAVFIPRHLYSSNSFRNGSKITYIIATIFTVPMIIKDIHLINGPDYPAALMRSTEIIIFIIMFYETATASREDKNHLTSGST